MNYDELITAIHDVGQCAQFALMMATATCAIFAASRVVLSWRAR